MSCAVQSKYHLLIVLLAVEPEVKVSDLTPSDELARKMRVHSGRSKYPFKLQSLNMV